MNQITWQYGVSCDRKYKDPKIIQIMDFYSLRFLLETIQYVVRKHKY